MDFSRMKYRVDLLPEDQRCIDVFPDLGDFAQIFDREDDLPTDDNGNALVDNDKVLRYLIYMYAPNSPLPIQKPDLNQRKQWALKAINIEAINDAGEVNAGYRELCTFTGDWATSRFVTFCLIQDMGHTLVANTNMEVMSIVSQRLLKDAATERASDLKNLREELTKAQEAYQTSIEKLVQDEAKQKNTDLVRFTINTKASGIRLEEAIKTYSERKKLFPTIIP